jgi:hypothetical protein
MTGNRICAGTWLHMTDRSRNQAYIRKNSTLRQLSEVTGDFPENIPDARSIRRQCSRPPVVHRQAPGIPLVFFIRPQQNPETAVHSGQTSVRLGLPRGFHMHPCSPIAFVSSIFYGFLPA